MSEHTPLTEAEADRLGDAILDNRHKQPAALIAAVRREVERILAARTSTATADTGLRERVEAVLLRLGAQSTHGCSGAEVQATYHTELDAALDATAAPTTDTGARDE